MLFMLTPVIIIITNHGEVAMIMVIKVVVAVITTVIRVENGIGIMDIMDIIVMDIIMI